MKSSEQIIKELNKIDLIKKIESEDHPSVVDVKAFYERFPQYSELEANGAFFVVAPMKLKGRPVKVYKFSNGDILFVGDVLDQKNVPLASIGDGLSMPAGFNWSKIEESSNGILSFVEEITWNS